MKLLMIDNYDSFTFNLVQLFYEFDIDVIVYRHDQCQLDQIARERPDWLCISPGPKTPREAGISKRVIARFAGEIPILGVCLGMQAINEVFGGKTVRAPLPRHGKCSWLTHTSEGLFVDLPSPFRVARYHSLQVIVQSPFIHPVAHADDGVVMAIQHKTMPVYGVQFHPESFMSEYGLELIANFLQSRQSDDRPWRDLIHEKDRFPRWFQNQHPSTADAVQEAVSQQAGGTFPNAVL